MVEHNQRMDRRTKRANEMLLYKFQVAIIFIQFCPQLPNGWDFTGNIILSFNCFSREKLDDTRRRIIVLDLYIFLVGYSESVSKASCLLLEMKNDKLSSMALKCMLLYFIFSSKKKPNKD